MLEPFDVYFSIFVKDRDDLRSEFAEVEGNVEHPVSNYHATGNWNADKISRFDPCSHPNFTKHSRVRHMERLVTPGWQKPPRDLKYREASLVRDNEVS